MGYNVDNTMTYTLQFADDQVVMAHSKEDLEYTVCAESSKKNILNGVLARILLKQNKRLWVPIQII
jgi:hypothetical protein